MRLSASPESEALVASATTSAPSADRVAPPQSARGKAVELWSVLTDAETGDLYYESELTGGFVLICFVALFFFDLFCFVGCGGSSIESCLRLRDDVGSASEHDAGFQYRSGSFEYARAHR